MRAVLDFDLRSLGKHMPRTRYQRGTLRVSVPAHGNRQERHLPRGYYHATWYAYVRQPDGTEIRRKREKIIDRELAEAYRIANDYRGPLTKADAQRVLAAIPIHPVAESRSPRLSNTRTQSRGGRRLPSEFAAATSLNAPGL